MATSSKKKTSKKVTKKKTTKKKSTTKSKSKPSSGMSLIELGEERIKSIYGSESIRKLTDDSISNVEVAFQTRIPKLNNAIGIGGIPFGRIIEVFGPESSGKTTLALTIIADCLNVGGSAYFIDAEHALDVAYAKKLGCDFNKILFSQPNTAEEGLDMVEKYCDFLIEMGNKDPFVFVVDSVAALTPLAEYEGDIGDKHVALQARLFSQHFRKIVSKVNKANATIIYINQIRARIGHMAGNTTTGGRALKFYASVRIDIRNTGKISDGSEGYVGNNTLVKIVKNKLAPPFKEFEIRILFNQGFEVDGIRDAFESLKDVEGVVKNHGWFTLPDGRKLSGLKGFVNFIEESRENWDYMANLVELGEFGGDE